MDIKSSYAVEVKNVRKLFNPTIKIYNQAVTFCIQVFENKWSDTKDAILLKLFINNDWQWVKLRLKHTDVQSIKKHSVNAKISVPTLEKKHKKWFLRFAFESKAILNKTPIASQKILAVDLRINTKT